MGKETLGDNEAKKWLAVERAAGQRATAAHGAGYGFNHPQILTAPAGAQENDVRELNLFYPVPDRSAVQS